MGWLIAVVLFYHGCCALGFNRLVASNVCKFSRQPTRSPNFDDGENLSQKECGVWNEKDAVSPPWAVSIIRGDRRADCLGILIAKNLILSEGCQDEATEKLEGSSFYAYIGKCFQMPTSDCLNDNLGRIEEIESVKSLSPVALGTKPLHLWLIRNEEEELHTNIMPVCLFNRDSSRDLDTSQIYASSFYKRGQKTRAQIVDNKECLGTNIYETECRNLNKTICVHFQDESKQDVLYNYFQLTSTPRYFLRGIYYYGFKPDYIMFFDVLHLLREIVDASEQNLYLSHPVPPVESRIAYSGGMGLSYPDCGLVTKRSVRAPSKQEAVPFLIGGKVAKKGQAPWHASLRFAHKDSSRVICGGSLITPWTVVTAAHCVQQNVYDYEVVLGLNNRLQPYTGNIQTQFPSKILIHPSYRAGSKKFENDLALLIFSNAFQITSQVRPICMWNQDYHIGTIVNIEGQVAGFGYDETYSARRLEQPIELRVVELPVRSFWECYLTNKEFFSEFLLPGKTFCGGQNGSTACVGDSGGGFAINVDGRWFLRGLVSLGILKNVSHTISCNPEYPSLYTDLVSYSRWIFHNMK